MKTARKLISRAIVLMAVCVLAMLSCSAAFADGEYRTVHGKSWRAFWRTSGNGEEISVFQVAVRNAPVTVRFAQEEGLCYEDSYTHYIDGRNGQEEEWGKYHVYYRMDGSTKIYVSDWDKTRRGANFELFLNNTGTYFIWVVPYTAQEMTDSWTLDTFIRWNKTPNWWVQSVSYGADYTSYNYLLQTNGQYGRMLSIKNIVAEF